MHMSMPVCIFVNTCGHIETHGEARLISGVSLSHGHIYSNDVQTSTSQWFYSKEKIHE